MFRCPLPDQTQSRARTNVTSLEVAIEVELSVLAQVLRVEVGRLMFLVVEMDYDSKEDRDDRRGIGSRSIVVCFRAPRSYCGAWKLWLRGASAAAQTGRRSVSALNVHHSSSDKRASSDDDSGAHS